MKELYIDLLEIDWKLEDIDEMDLFYYIDLLAYKANKEYGQNVEVVLKIL